MNSNISNSKLIALRCNSKPKNVLFITIQIDNLPEGLVDWNQKKSKSIKNFLIINFV